MNIDENILYEPVRYWAKLPHPMFFKEATSVAVDSKDNVYVFNRGKYPLIIFDKDGNFLDTWGEGEFIRPHGIKIDKEDNLYLVDDMAHFVQKRTKNGDLIWQLGDTNNPGEKQKGDPFNQPTDIAIHPKTGDLFITDGYGNSRVHRYDSEGNLLLSWGEPGSFPGQFSLPHNIAFYGDETVVICDRENFRLQYFNLDGDFKFFKHMHRPIAITEGLEKYQLVVAEAGPPPVQDGVPNLGLRIEILNKEGDRISRFGNGTLGEDFDQFIAPHGLAIDSDSSIYIAEVSYTSFGSNLNPPREMISLRKWSIRG